MKVDTMRDCQRNGGRTRTAFILGVFLTLCLLYFNGLGTTTSLPVVCNRHLADHGAGSPMNKKRLELYKRMSTDLDRNGAGFLDGGETSQSLKLSDLFKIVNGKATPVLKPANPPVRANIIYLEYQYASTISKVVKKVFSPHFSNQVWYQDPKLYHFSLFHASHHLEPVPATETEVESEYDAVEQVAKSCCPLHLVLDRVVLTSTGVLLGCWQVLNGTDPSTIRAELRNVLSQAPKSQFYAPEILHTSFARILGAPKLSTQVGTRKGKALALLKNLVVQLNDELCNFQATVKELWFVQERDVLALALNGHIQTKVFPLYCSKS